MDVLVRLGSSKICDVLWLKRVTSGAASADDVTANRARGPAAPPICALLFLSRWGGVHNARARLASVGFAPRCQSGAGPAIVIRLRQFRFPTTAVAAA